MRADWRTSELGAGSACSASNPIASIFASRSTGDSSGTGSAEKKMGQAGPERRPTLAAADSFGRPIVFSGAKIIRRGGLPRRVIQAGES